MNEKSDPRSSITEKNGKLNQLLKMANLLALRKSLQNLKESFGKEIVADTVRRYIKRFRYNARAAPKKPHVSETNKNVCTCNR